MDLSYLKNICRTCLRIPKHPINLFQNDAILMKKIQFISSVEIEYRDELSELICEECYNYITQFNNFKKLILNTDFDLRTRLETLEQTHRSREPSVQKIFIKAEINYENEETNEQTNKITKKSYKTKHNTKDKGIFKCPECERICSTSSQLASHKISFHTPKSICDICGLKVRFKSLNRHMQVHSGKPIPCEQCGKVLKNSESMKSHKLHHFQRTSCCDICGRIYKSRSEYAKHMKRHTDPNYGKKQCPVCQKIVFGLSKHMLSHTGAKPFICLYCKKGFITAYKLKLHTRIHTNERPCRCEHCPNAFTSPWLLKRHLKNKHGI